jgi:hypothetical protein
MDKNSLIRKCLAVGIILLFVSITCFPTICAHDDTILSKAFSIPQKEDTLSITVLEYKSDGTMETSVVEMAPEQVVTLSEELTDVNDMDTRLSIYKKYNLIPQNVTADTLRVGMEERAQKMHPEIENLQKSITNNDDGHFCINFNCEIEATMAYGLRFLGGLSLITCIFNEYSYYGYEHWLRSIDVFQFLIGLAGSLSAVNGLLPDCYSTGFLYAILLVGFVGYFVKVNPVPSIFITRMCFSIGYSVAAMCYGGFPYPE